MYSDMSSGKLAKNILLVLGFQYSSSATVESKMKKKKFLINKRIAPIFY